MNALELLEYEDIVAIKLNAENDTARFYNPKDPAQGVELTKAQLQQFSEQLMYLGQFLPHS